MGLFKRKKKAEQTPQEIKTEERYDKGLSKSRNRFKEGLLSLFGRGMKISDDFIDDIEAFLYESDLGVEVCDLILEKIRSKSRTKELITYDDIKVIMTDIFEDMFEDDDLSIPIEEHHPCVILVVGVNGAGKTTTIGKLAAKYRGEDKKVLIVAGDTYRAAAIEQLEVWAERAGVDIINPAGARRIYRTEFGGSSGRIYESNTDNGVDRHQIGRHSQRWLHDRNKKKTESPGQIYRTWGKAGRSEGL